MNKPKSQNTYRITTRIHSELREEIKSSAAANGWTPSDEIHHRIRSTQITQKIDKLESEIAELKAMIKSLLDK